MENFSSEEIGIQLHYHFKDDDKHSMNAEIFNECEKQFIRAIKAAEKYFEETIYIEVKPRKEGSLIDILSIAINNPELRATFTTLITVFTTKFFDSKLSTAKHRTDETSKKLENLQKIKESIKNGDLTENDFDYIASHDKDLRKYKSNFFKSAKREVDITKIETCTSFQNRKPTIIIIAREHFDDFILTETTEQLEEIQIAKIYIVAPVLVQGKRNPTWSGIYEEQPIMFKVSDKDFLQQVYEKQIKFTNGTFINCEVKVTNTTNIETDETKISREVINVFNYGEDNNSIKKIIHRRKITKNDGTKQLSFFPDLS